MGVLVPNVPEFYGRALRAQALDFAAAIRGEPSDAASAEDAARALEAVELMLNPAPR